MKDRIQRIITRENISASKFADIIGVQRSSISHILSGRNNPGLDFLNKILIHFPHISGDWLITGQGNMVKPSLNGPKMPTLFDKKPAESIPDTNPLVQPHPSSHELLPPVATNVPKIERNTNEGQATAFNEVSIERQSEKPNAVSLQQTGPVERIIIFYDDKTFDTYTPRKL
jgi:transcriptional regulator with XRE-family HTH domain